MEGLLHVDQVDEVTVNASGQATFTTSAFAVGSHSITAEYGGDANFGASESSTLNQAVGK
jgi:Bacterial Ig-like domain (group 3)